MKNKVPKLRFSEFSGEWEEKRLENLFDEFRSGKGITIERIREIGNYPVYGGNGLRGFTTEYTHEGKYFLIGRQGALCGNINKFKGRAYVSEHAIACKANFTSDTEWLAQRLEHYNLNKISESSAQPGLSVNKLLKLKLTIPIKEEQEKIANFLSSVDIKIEKLEKKKELLEKYKKGMMQKLFSQKLRFKDDNGNDYPEWKEKRLGEIGFFQTSSVDKLYIEGEKEVKLVNYMNVYRHEKIDNNAIKNYQIVTAKNSQIQTSNLSRGDILFTPSSETPEDIGHSVVIFEDLEKCVFSYHLMRFRPNIELDILYSHYFCNNKNVLNQIIRLATGSTRFTISVKSFSSIKILLPAIPEQEKIANFLSSIDRKIELIERELEKNKEFKKGLLQQMFV